MKNTNHPPTISHEDLQAILDRDYITPSEAAKVLQMNRGSLRYVILKGKVRTLRINVLRKNGEQYIKLIRREDMENFHPRPYSNYRVRSFQLAS